MSYTYSRTREQLRDMVARKLGVKEAGQNLPPDDAAIILEGIDLRLKELHAMRVMWPGVSGSQTSVAITAGQATATISAVDYGFPLSLMLTVGAQQQPVDMIGHRQFQAIPDKATSGDPAVALIVGSTIRMHPVPRSSGSLKLTYAPIAEDSANGVAVDMPIEMLRPLSIVVAAGLIDDFDVDAAASARLLGQVEQSMREIRALSAQRIDATTVIPEWF